MADWYTYTITKPPCYPYGSFASYFGVVFKYSDGKWTCEKLIFMIHRNQRTNKQSTKYYIQNNAMNEKRSGFGFV